MARVIANKGSFPLEEISRKMKRRKILSIINRITVKLNLNDSEIEGFYSSSFSENQLILISAYMWLHSSPMDSASRIVRDCDPRSTESTRVVPISVGRMSFRCIAELKFQTCLCHRIRQGMTVGVYLHRES